ncbi:MAG: protein kinase domain-containing protein, partial [Legionella sp.]
MNKEVVMSELITLNLCAQESAAYIMLLLQHYPQKKQFYPFDVYAITIPATEQDKTTELRMQLSHILLAFDKPTAGARDDNLKPAARYYAVVKNQFLGSGSFGSVRPVRGTWKIEDGQALFKVKSDIYKQRVLKTLFFTAEPFNPQHTPAASYEETKRKNEQRDALTQEQIIASYTPHLSTKYPIIETDEGVHLLMRRQPGVDLFAMISSLQGNPQQISVIQRLLLCLELYETLEQEVHSVTTANNGKLIHRDIKPQNIILYQQGYLFKTHVVDYGMCTSSDSTQSLGSSGSPLYMDPVVYNDGTSSPVPSAANDLFAVAIICAQIWGDTRRQTMTSTYLAQENSNIQFSNLFTNIV